MWNGFTGLAEECLCMCFQLHHDEVQGASQKWGFMINYCQDEWLIDMLLENGERYFTVTISPCCFSPFLNLIQALAALDSM